jgi:hypothetical protein
MKEIFFLNPACRHFMHVIGNSEKHNSRNKMTCNFFKLFSHFLLSNYYVLCDKSLLSIAMGKSNLVESANAIIAREFVWKTFAINYILALSDETKDEQMDLINDVVLTSSGHVFIEDLEHLMENNRTRFYNVIFVDEFVSFVVLYENVIRKFSDKFVMDGLFLLIFVNGSFPEIDLIVPHLWKNYTLNVNFLIEELDVVYLKTFVPFAAGKCGDTSLKIINHFVNGSFAKAGEFFPQKLSNLYQCPVKVVTFDCPPMMMIKRPKSANESYQFHGVDGQIFTTIKERLNFKEDLFINDLDR